MNKATILFQLTERVVLGDKVGKCLGKISSIGEYNFAIKLSSKFDFDHETLNPKILVH